MTTFYRVGGCVRDSFLGVNSKDIDFAVEAESFSAMREAIAARGGKIFLETPEFFTIRAHVPGLGSSDFVLCRKDGKYSNGRHPDNVEAGTIEDDLARRDFTCNAIAIHELGTTIIDPHGGRQDIKRKTIKCVGNPIERFNEDKLRIIRAIRFAITKGFGIDTETQFAMQKYQANDFTAVSTERIREELLKMFAADSWRSISYVREYFPEIGHLMISRGIWLKPTLESK